MMCHTELMGAAADTVPVAAAASAMDGQPHSTPASTGMAANVTPSHPAMLAAARNGDNDTRNGGGH